MSILALVLLVVGVLLLVLAVFGVPRTVARREHSATTGAEPVVESALLRRPPQSRYPL